MMPPTPPLARELSAAVSIPASLMLLAFLPMAAAERVLAAQEGLALVAQAAQEWEALVVLA